MRAKNKQQINYKQLCALATGAHAHKKTALVHKRRRTCAERRDDDDEKLKAHSLVCKSSVNLLHQLPFEPLHLIQRTQCPEEVKRATTIAPIRSKHVDDEFSCPKEEEEEAVEEADDEAKRKTAH